MDDALGQRHGGQLLVAIDATHLVLDGHGARRRAAILHAAAQRAKPGGRQHELLPEEEPLGVVRRADHTHSDPRAPLLHVEVKFHRVELAGW